MRDEFDAGGGTPALFRSARSAKEGNMPVILLAARALAGLPARLILYNFTTMHEWALAESVIKTAVEHSKAQKLKKLKETGVLFGELQAIDKEIFVFALEELRAQFPAAKACKFKVSTEPAAFRCKACSHEFPLKGLKKTKDESEFIHFVPEMAHTFLKCPKCKSPDFEIARGRGVSISYIKGER